MSETRKLAAEAAKLMKKQAVRLPHIVQIAGIGLLLHDSYK